jgi:hypothetical protein
MKKLIPLLILVLVFAACGQKPVSGSLSSTSPDGKTTISVNGKKASSLDPFTVTLEVKSGKESMGSLQFEITASALDASNVKFDWSDANNCIITFTHSDGEKRVFRYYATASNVILREETKN